MLPLNRPTQTACETFTICISRVRNAALKARLQGVTQVVVDASAAFDVAGRAQALHQIVRGAVVGADVTAIEMEKVYSQRMAKVGAPGRDVYDELIGAAPQDKCPLCGHNSVTMLDHHLPKAYYPVLAVVPLNLVPSCSDCNKTKLASIPHGAEDVSLHPYFDNIDNYRWLRATVIETRPAALRFYVETDNRWGAILQHRVQNHFNMLRLGQLYASEAAEELVNIRYGLTQLRAAAGIESVKSDLNDRALSCAHARRNGWRTSAYEAWATSDWFCNGGFEPAG
jgi:hypothetical protein